jgi:hypothetical protein
MILSNKWEMLYFGDHTVVKKHTMHRYNSRGFPPNVEH